MDGRSGRGISPGSSSPGGRSLVAPHHSWIALHLRQTTTALFLPLHDQVPRPSSRPSTSRRLPLVPLPRSFHQSGDAYDLALSKSFGYDPHSAEEMEDESSSTDNDSIHFFSLDSVRTDSVRTPSRPSTAVLSLRRTQSNERTHAPDTRPLPSRLRRTLPFPPPSSFPVLAPSTLHLRLEPIPHPSPIFLPPTPFSTQTSAYRERERGSSTAPASADRTGGD